METTLESKFFNAFEVGGVVDRCVNWISDILISSRGFSKEKMQNVWHGVYDNKEPQQIEERTKGFADWFKGRWQNLFLEIQANLDACSNDAAKDRYLITLLTPFSDIQAAFSSKDIRNITVKGKGNVERCFSYFDNVLWQYANRLAALLLSYGIDLLELQKETGVYLIESYDITALSCYYPYNGSLKLACRDINRLPNYKQEQAEKGLYLPVELQKYKEIVDTPKARICFAVAISKGFIYLLEDKGYRKADGISVSQLAYFLQSVYVDIKTGGVFPNKALELLFNERGLKQAASKLADNKTGKPKGYKIVDEILDEAAKELGNKNVQIKLNVK